MTEAPLADGDTADGAGSAHSGGCHGHGKPPLSWADARSVAATAAVALPPVERTLTHAAGHRLARPLVSLTDLPAFDTSAMDGWAITGSGPWRIVPAKLLAGRASVELRLADGEAAEIATGAPLPDGATAVLRREHGRVDGERLSSASAGTVPAGTDVRRRGQECRAGDELLPAGMRVTPPVVGLAAATGHDMLTVTARPRLQLLVLGDELLADGLPRDGRIRDALGPMLSAWLPRLDVEPAGPAARLTDDAAALRAAVTASDVNVIVTTGGTAGGTVDHVHPVLALLDAELLVDGVAVRPGHPMLLARLAADRFWVGLPGNPLAAVAGLLTLVVPLLCALAGEATTPACRRTVVVTEPIDGHPQDTRLVPVRADGTVLRYAGPAMLRGLALADGLAVVPPGGVRPGHEVELLTTREVPV